MKKHVKGIYWYIKRFFDIFFSLILIIITFPIMIIVSLCLFINLGRPLWNQRRYREYSRGARQTDRDINGYSFNAIQPDSIYSNNSP